MVEVRRGGRTADTYTSHNCRFKGVFGTLHRHELHVTGSIPVTKGYSDVAIVFTGADFAYLAAEMMRADPAAATKAFGAALMARDASVDAEKA
jgi:hypothetical protein